MANKKRKTTTSKKKTNNSSKVNATKKKTTTTAKKKTNNNIKTNTVKKTTQSKKNLTSKEKTDLKLKAKILEPEKIEIPKKKEQPKTKEISKNKNEAKKVVKTESLKKEKKVEPTRVEKVESAIKKEIELSSQPLKRKKKNDISKKFSKNKKSIVRKKYNKLVRRIKMYGFNSVFPIKKIIIAIILLATLITIPIVVKNVLLNKKSGMDLSAISEKIDQVKTISFNIDDTNNIITSSNAFAGLKDYYEYDFKNVFDLDSKYVENYVIKYNKSKGYAFIAIKATEGNQENIKNTFDKFFKENKISNYEYLEYGNYQFYIKSKDEDSDKIVLSKIRQSQIRVFNILQELKRDEIEKVTGISSTYYSESLVKVAMLRSDTCQYLIFKPSNAMSKTKIINTMNDYYAGLESKWQNTNKENYELVRTRHFEEYNGYLIFIVSHDNDLVMNLIKS